MWFARGSRSEFDHAEPIVPDGCVELIFNLADPFEQIDETGARHRQPRDLLVGPTIQPTTAVPTGDVDLLGLRFWPGRTSAFLRAPMWSLTDRLISMSSVLSGADRLLDDLCEQHVDERLDHLATAFAARAQRGISADRRSRCALSLDAIERHRGDVSIETLSSMTGVSRRHLERQFQDEVGLGAKHIARIARVHHALRVMKTHRVVQRRRHCGALRLHRSGASHSRVPRVDGDDAESPDDDGDDAGNTDARRRLNRSCGNAMSIKRVVPDVSANRNCLRMLDGFLNRRDSNALFGRVVSAGAR